MQRFFSGAAASADCRIFAALTPRWSCSQATRTWSVECNGAGGQPPRYFTELRTHRRIVALTLGGPLALWARVASYRSAERPRDRAACGVSSDAGDGRSRGARCARSVQFPPAWLK